MTKNFTKRPFKEVLFKMFKLVIFFCCSLDPRSENTLQPSMLKDKKLKEKHKSVNEMPRILFDYLKPCPKGLIIFFYCSIVFTTNTTCNK